MRDYTNLLLPKRFDSGQIKEANRTIFDQNSRGYSKKRRIPFDKKTSLRLVQRYENATKKNFVHADRLLDIGCGSGYLLLNLASTGLTAQSYGIDISLGMLKECRQYADNLGIKVNLAQADVDFLPLRSNSFDFVIGHAILHHLPNINSVFHEVRRILKPGGICIFTEPTKMGSRIIACFMWLAWFFPLLFRQITKTQTEKMVEIDAFAPERLENEAKKAGFNKFYTRPFAGFISRIFYWLLDPISQRTTNRLYHKVIDSIISALSIVDDRLLRLFVPADWFDELFIYMEK
jgi:ubiquinone/menaquinone biosynthesis C-methylase UbiE